MQEFFFSQPYGSISKTDLQEKIVYLYDKYSETGLLSKRDFELSNILKCKISTVSSLKYNIKKKFSEPMNCEDPSEFVKDILKLNIYNHTEEGIELLIENRAVKDCFEFWYETALNKPLVYKRNAKAVPMETGDFYKMLEFLLGKIDEEKFKDLIEECKKHLKGEK